MIAFFPEPFPVVTDMIDRETGQPFEGYIVYVKSSGMFANDCFLVALDDGRLLHFETNQLRVVPNGTYMLGMPPRPPAPEKEQLRDPRDYDRHPEAYVHRYVTKMGRTTCGMSEYAKVAMGEAGVTCPRCLAPPGSKRLDSEPAPALHSVYMKLDERGDRYPAIRCGIDIDARPAVGTAAKQGETTCLACLHHELAETWDILKRLHGIIRDGGLPVGVHVETWLKTALENLKCYAEYTKLLHDIAEQHGYPKKAPKGSIWDWLKEKLKEASHARRPETGSPPEVVTPAGAGAGRNPVVSAQTVRCAPEQVPALIREDVEAAHREKPKACKHCPVYGDDGCRYQYPGYFARMKEGTYCSGAVCLAVMKGENPVHRMASKTVAPTQVRPKCGASAFNLQMTSEDDCVTCPTCKER